MSDNANYAIFEEGPDSPFTGLNHPPVSETEIPFPAETIVWSDGQMTNTFKAPVNARHLDTVTGVLADGHAGAFPCREHGQTYTDFRGVTHQRYDPGARAGAYAGTAKTRGLKKADGSFGALR